MQINKEMIDKIKIIVMDVDGTLTDGKIYMGADGELMKAFDIKDGHAIYHFKDFGIVPAIITGRSSKIVESRCKELKIEHFYQGVSNKLEKLSELLVELGKLSGEEYSFENVAYAGDDIIDLECMKKCGVAVCPADAVDEVKAVSHFISTKGGGNGAIREFYDFIKNQKGKI
jgi:3-deoxy-D-manno-octulosonate 8-phosphate phosphatase (KDO 8-P phosphatase)